MKTMRRAGEKAVGHVGYNTRRSGPPGGEIDLGWYYQRPDGERTYHVSAQAAADQLWVFACNEAV